MYSLHFDNETFDEIPSGAGFQFWEKTRFYFRVVGCCNGLVCLSDDLFGFSNTVILWNPSIRRAFTLPVPRFDSHERYMLALGFGVDPVTNDHKVVRMNYLKAVAVFGVEYIVPPVVEVFSLSSGNWRSIKTTSPYNVPERFWSQALINGVVHWVAYHVYESGTFRNLVMSFDMGSEEFGELNLPESLVKLPTEVMSAAIFGGSLTILQYDALRYTRSCSVWVMKEYGIAESWSHQFHVDLGEGFGLALGLRRNGEILLATSRGELVSYNYWTRKRFNIGKRGTKDSFHVDSYTESLILLTEGYPVLEKGARKVGYASSLSEKIEGWRQSGIEGWMWSGIEGWMPSVTVPFLAALILFCWPAVFCMQLKK
ncbi:hypothetical protein Vadar_022478 [Vaccinium darrowii]|uniref:Uncharacterized protein n=1 Tax=Vaccinium darrowii TaxID=229202 RepID=A0ACB7Z6X4_9ERIC|nr:hypothetical protein Vadar_022478 [Vaccinium darrowii]